MGLGVLERLTESQMQNALSIAASNTSGVRANFGTMTKPYHAGMAAQRVWESVHLARAGMTAGTDSLNSDHGLVGAYLGRKLDDHEISGIVKRGLGSLDTLAGLSLKPYPSCAATHAAIAGVIELLGSRSSDEVERIRVGVPAFTLAPLIYPAPTNGLEAKFSMEYCVAVAATQLFVGLEDFNDSSILEPLRSEFMPRVEMMLDTVIAAATEPIARVTVLFKDGSTSEVLVDPAPGKGERWLDEITRAAKIEACIRFGGFSKASVQPVLNDFIGGGTVGSFRESISKLQR